MGTPPAACAKECPTQIRGNNITSVSTVRGLKLVPRVPLDGVERIYSYADMPRYALAAVVGMETL